ncbi:hypothetical protein FB45DRAFT_900447 [Roridomyces roridus]|uniref:Uncharacterized protein n=1 Tax=Roridomyces roridus TaxID=1738132 RepID=A0AAD7C841_9AGAR|nr:hypothetical protein FB45DRAFT_900447 [Roridomyces roridus]
MKDLVLVAIVIMTVKTVLTTVVSLHHGSTKASSSDSRSRSIRMSNSMVKLRGNLNFVGAPRYTESSKLLVGRHHERISYAGRGELALVAPEAENVLLKLAIGDQNCGLNFCCIEDLLQATLDFKFP